MPAIDTTLMATRIEDVARTAEAAHGVHLFATVLAAADRRAGGGPLRPQSDDVRRAVRVGREGNLVIFVVDGDLQVVDAVRELVGLVEEVGNRGCLTVAGKAQAQNQARGNFRLQHDIPSVLVVFFLIDPAEAPRDLCSR